MKFGVLGTGTVGRTIGARLAVLGHDVRIGTRDVATTLASTELNHITQETFADWHAKNAYVGLGTFAEASDHGELVVNAVMGAHPLDALRAAGEANLDGIAALLGASGRDDAGLPAGCAPPDRRPDRFRREAAPSEEPRDHRV